jgi:hypothetical protein
MIKKCSSIWKKIADLKIVHEFENWSHIFNYLEHLKILEKGHALRERLDIWFANLEKVHSSEISSCTWKKIMHLKIVHRFEQSSHMFVNLKSSCVQKLLGHLKIDRVFDKSSRWKVSVCFEKVHGCLQIWKKFTHFKISHAFQICLRIQKRITGVCEFLKNSCFWKLLTHLKKLNGCPPIWKISRIWKIIMHLKNLHIFGEHSHNWKKFTHLENVRRCSQIWNIFAHLKIVRGCL